MANRDIVVIGGSAGGMAALRRLCALLPANLDASLFAVLHIGQHADTALDAILSKAGPLHATFARDGEPFAPGRIYLAPPDRHLLLDDGRTHLRRGPRENMSRPAIDPLFRSAAVAGGARVMAMVLSGTLSDGSVGLRAVKRCGGIGLVQDPSEADFAEMPESAIAWGAPDHIGPIGELAKTLVHRVGERAQAVGECPKEIRIENEIAFGSRNGTPMDRIPGTRSFYSCPECNGALWEIKDGDFSRYRCHVGHAFSADAMIDANSEQLERALWSALRVLEERAELLRTLAARAAKGAHPRSEARYRARMSDYEEQARLIRDLMARARKPVAHAGWRRTADVAGELRRRVRQARK